MSLMLLHLRFYKAGSYAARGQRLIALCSMAKSKFEYVREYEQDLKIARNNYIVLRIDGRGFHRFADKYNFEKPNDDRALNLMSCAAEAVMKSFNDIFIAYGESDEYSFVFRRETSIFERRLSKLISIVPSLFSSAYVLNWSNHFPSHPLKLCDAPTFDARATPYPLEHEIRDYLSWRQEDCHINNLNNYCIWKLVQMEGMTTGEAQKQINTLSKGDKNELLFSRFGINYNNLPPMHRKGTVLLWETPKSETGDEVQHHNSADVPMSSITNAETSDIHRLSSSTKKRRQLVRLHVDMNDTFWQQRTHLMAPLRPAVACR